LAAHGRQALQQLNQKLTAACTIPLEAGASLSETLRALKSQGAYSKDVIVAKRVELLEFIDKQADHTKEQSSICAVAEERRRSIVATSAYKATTIFRTLPTNLDLFGYNPVEWRDSMSIQLNLPLRSGRRLPSRCPCADKAAMRGGLHLIDCKSGTVRYATHRSMTKALSRACRAADVCFELEPPAANPWLQPADNKRLDITMFQAGRERGKVGVDVTTIDPLAPSYKPPPEFRHDSNHASSLRRKQKLVKYKDVPHTFIPFVLDSTGGWHPKNNDFTKVLMHEVEMNGKKRSQRWWQIQLAHDHRKAMLHAIHLRQKAIVTGPTLDPHDNDDHVQHAGEAGAHQRHDPIFLSASNA
jgi:hypothetical protein